MCTCSEFVQALPVVCIMLLTIWTYYTYVYEVCFLLISGDLKRWVYISCYHLLLLLYIVMYFLTMYKKDWTVPEAYWFSRSFYNELLRVRNSKAEESLLEGFIDERGMLVYMRDRHGSYRYCTVCKLLKPDRSHHCTTCDVCVIKMDHHCPWLNNCIGFTNYKYFIIVVIYSSVFCWYYFFTTLEFVMDFFMHLGSTRLREINVVLAMSVMVVIAIALTVLFIFHMKLILNNETTVEAIHSPIFARVEGVRMITFDKGWRENYEEICGLNCCLWFLPEEQIMKNSLQMQVSLYISNK